MNGLDAYMNAMGSGDQAGLQQLLALAMQEQKRRRAAAQTQSWLETLFGPQRGIGDIGLSNEQFLRSRSGGGQGVGGGGGGGQMQMLVPILQMLMGGMQGGGQPSGGGLQQPPNLSSYGVSPVTYPGLTQTFDFPLPEQEVLREADLDAQLRAMGY